LAGIDTAALLDKANRMREECASFVPTHGNPSVWLGAIMRVLHQTPKLETYRLATTVGYRPRFLHSTGQLHKDGPGTGLFLQLMGDTRKNVPIPGEPYTFGMLADAQALGDLRALQGLSHPMLPGSIWTQTTKRLFEGWTFPVAKERIGKLYLRDIGMPPGLYGRAPLDLDVGPIFVKEEIVRLW
jgi:hypothetical protein